MEQKAASKIVDIDPTTSIPFNMNGANTPVKDRLPWWCSG